MRSLGSVRVILGIDDEAQMIVRYELIKPSAQSDENERVVTDAQSVVTDAQGAIHRLRCFARSVYSRSDICSEGLSKK